MIIEVLCLVVYTFVAALLLFITAELFFLAIAIGCPSLCPKISTYYEDGPIDSESLQSSVHSTEPEVFEMDTLDGPERHLQSWTYSSFSEVTTAV